MQRYMKNQANMTTPRETNDVLVTNPKEMEIYILPDKEFKTIILKISEIDARENK